MTEKQQKSAGYFDSVRNCPMYEGDVYYREGYIEPFFKIVNTTEKGFLVHHVGSTETFALSEIGSELINSQYIGNILDDPDIIDKFKNNPSDVVAGYIAPQTEELVENDIADADKPTSELEEKIAAVEQANEELKECNEELKENIETMFNAPSEVKEEENEQPDNTDSDAATTENEPNTDEVQADGTGTDNAADAEPAKAENNDKPTESKNVIVEVAKEAVPEVIANTKDEKNALLRKKFIQTQIQRNADEIIKLGEKVAYHSELASTLDFEPFVKLKNLVREDLHTKVDDENVKGIKERTKDFESIVNIQNLLKDHQQKAKDAENHIADLEDENSKFSDELAELEAKIDTFAKQMKLPTGTEE